MLVNSDGTTSELFYNEALDQAREQGLDLVEVAKNGDKSVFKLLDKGKFLYEQKKKNKLQKKNANIIVTKEIQFSVRTEQHDIETKVNHIKEFLSKDYEVKIIVEMKGREKANTQSAVEKLNNILKMFEHDIKNNSLKVSNNNVMVMVCKKK
jgi:translation initiation factor IF-3